MATCFLFFVVAIAAGAINSLGGGGGLITFTLLALVLPLYAAGVSLIRSLVWNVATIGIMLLIVALFLG